MHSIKYGWHDDAQYILYTLNMCLSGSGRTWNKDWNAENLKWISDTVWIQLLVWWEDGNEDGETVKSEGEDVEKGVYATWYITAVVDQGLIIMIKVLLSLPANKETCTHPCTRALPRERVLWKNAALSHSFHFGCMFNAVGTGTARGSFKRRSLMGRRDWLVWTFPALWRHLKRRRVGQSCAYEHALLVEYMW